MRRIALVLALASCRPAAPAARSVPEPGDPCASDPQAAGCAANGRDDRRHDPVARPVAPSDPCPAGAPAGPGCPPLDSDDDRIVDADDRCPHEPEDHNGLEDDDGCPDQATRIVIVNTHPARPKHITFARAGSTRLPDHAENVLAELVKVLREHPAVRVAIDGHADPREANSEAGRERLGLRRAEVVRDHLVAQGIDPARIELRSFGGTRPLTAGATDDQRARNRRVELLALDPPQPATSP
ncbi:OmpA family protein [Nannocystis pusilla]|uniref:OmpA family protein n=1 Tax=Nannocystis pusilla TaxID=889268 RepID=A0ABS7TQJ5_9BACT|nr:OmpA family protein [Nannocystis pusilla]